MNLSYDHMLILPHEKAVEFNAIAHWQSSEYLDFRDLAGAYQGGYSRSNVNPSHGRLDERYKITAFVRNVEGKAILATAAVPAPGGQFTGTLMVPRTCGLRLDVKL